MTLQAKAPWGDPELTRRKANQARRCGGDRGCAGHGFGEWIINKGVTPPSPPLSVLAPPASLSSISGRRRDHSLWLPVSKLQGSLIVLCPVCLPGLSIPQPHS